MSSQASDLDRLYLPWRRRILTALWLTYASFYLCRVNMAIALPSLMEEFGYSKTLVGGLGSTFFIVYALGQFLNGQLGDKWGVRRMIPIGIFVSAGLNVAFGFTNTFLAMSIIWGANGYAQAMGWAPSVKTLANWFPVEQRGKVSAIYGTCYQAGNVMSWLLAGYLAHTYGWRYAFWVPAGIFALFGIYVHWAVRNAPEEVGLPPIEAYGNGTHSEQRTIQRDEHLGFAFTLRQTLGNARVWQAGLAYLFISVVAYGFLYWIPTYLAETHDLDISHAATRGIVLPLMGILGILCAGWISDHWFQSRRAPIITLMLIIASGLLALYPHISLSSPWVGLACLGLVGFATFGPHALTVTGVAMDLGTRKAASSATGFIDALGYVGATLTSIGTGWLVEHHTWTIAFYCWSGSLLIAALLMGAMWNYRPKQGRYH